MFDELASESVSLKEKIQKRFSKPSNPRTLKLFAVTFLLLLVIPTGIWFFTKPSYSSHSNNDPTTVLWSASDPNNDASEFNLRNTVRSACGFSGPFCILLQPNSTDYSIALAKSEVDISTISGKELLWGNFWKPSGGSCCGLNQNWGFYLTRNGTLPTGSAAHSYNPKNDPNVALLTEEYATGGGNYVGHTFIQRNAAKTVNQEDTGSCAPASNCFLTASTSTDPTLSQDGFSVYLNFTGAGIAGSCNAFFVGPGCSQLGIQGNSGTSQKLPQLVFQGTKYYVGYFASKGLPFNVLFQFDTAAGGFEMFLGNYNPSQPPSPTIDTGGFFGPIIKALISIGVFILQQVVTVFTFVGAVVVTALNAIGGFFGLGSLGTDLQNFFSGISNWFSTVLGGIFGNFLSLVNLAGNGLTLFFNFIGSTLWTNLVSFLGLLAPFWGIATTIWGYLTTLLTSGGIGLNFFFMLDYIYGMFLLSRKGMEGFNQWINTNETIFIKTWKIGNLAFQYSVMFLVQAKQLIAQWI